MPRPLVYLTDRQNSVLGIVDSQGTFVERYKYDSFGRINQSNIPSAYADIGDNNAYTGSFLDPNTLLLNNRGRFYNPAGRWLGPAPQGWSTDPNKYRYGGDNPANHEPDANDGILVLMLENSA
jgi:RHS repeat-associated protein